MLKLLLLISIAFLSCNTPRQGNALNKLTDEEKAEGWELLFDGKSMNGWHKYGGEPVGSAWKIRDGYLYLDTSVKKNGSIVGGGDIVTEQEYENFHFRTEWKMAPGGNSGIFFFVQEDTTRYNWPWETGPEMQLLDNQGHPEGKVNTHRAGDLFDLIACSKITVKPAGEWNLSEVKVVGNKLELYQNGELVISTNLWDEDWKKLIFNSKFRDMPGFGIYRKGKIGLQDHQNEVQFRNIRIRKL
jgi:hypothetical protein